jgi:hypothetical protein
LKSGVLFLIYKRKTIDMASEQRNEIADKLAIVNKLIKKGYKHTIETVTEHRDFCMSIKDTNYYEIKDRLMSELYPLVHSLETV